MSVSGIGQGEQLAAYTVPSNASYQTREHIAIRDREKRYRELMLAQLMAETGFMNAQSQSMLDKTALEREKFNLDRARGGKQYDSRDWINARRRGTPLQKTDYQKRLEVDRDRKTSRQERLEDLRAEESIKFEFLKKMLEEQNKYNNEDSFMEQIFNNAGAPQIVRLRQGKTRR